MPLEDALGVEFSGGGDTFILGPGYEAVGNGQVPQSLPASGEALDGSPLVSQSAPSTLPFSASAAPQSAIVSPSLSPIPLPSMSAGPSAAISYSPLSVLPSISVSMPVRLLYPVFKMQRADTVIAVVRYICKSERILNFHRL